MKKVLIAHQSTIPHYRVCFYNALQKCKPDDWQFDVVFDPSELKDKKFFQEELDPNSFNFPILKVSTFSTKLAKININYQTFWRKAAEYDLIVIEQALNNLTYPLCHFYKLKGTKLIYWGHGKHRKLQNHSLFRSLLEQMKIKLTRQADAFFAYTPLVKHFMVEKGFSSDRVFVLNNTIDINKQRQAFEKLKRERNKIRKSLGIVNKKVLLFVGRFSQSKRIELLLEAFSIIQERDASFYLLLVGSGGENYLSENLQNVSYFGPITNLDKLAPIYVAADVFSFPGSVGLGPIQALCYDLPVVTIASQIHPPEIEYLLPTNSLILSSDTTSKDYAQSIIELFADSEKLSRFKNNIWSTIEHLTIEQMAQNFANGINSILN